MDARDGSSLEPLTRCHRGRPGKERMRANAPPDGHSHLDRAGGLAQPNHDRAGPVHGDRRTGPRPGGRVHGRSVRRVLPRWRGDRGRRGPADPTIPPPPPSPHREHHRDRRRGGDDRWGGDAVASSAQLSRRGPPDFDPHGRPAGSWGRRSPRSSSRPRSHISPRSPRSSGRGSGPRVTSCCCSCSTSASCCRCWGSSRCSRSSEIGPRGSWPGRGFLRRHWPGLFAGLAFLAGVFVVALGVTGLGAAHSHFLRHLHHTLHG